MNISAPFISRPVATTLLTLGIALAGILAFLKLPVAPLPQVDFPTISVSAQLPGASPDTVATSVAEPLERHLGQIADVTEMTSQSGIGQTRITLQFDLNRDIDGAARDVQAAINAARADLPASLKTNPTYRKVNPADAPILILAHHVEDADARPDVRRGEQRLSAAAVADRRHRPGHSSAARRCPRCALSLIRKRCSNTASDLRTCAPRLLRPTPTARKAPSTTATSRFQIYTNDQATKASDYAPLIIAYRNGAAVRLSDVADVQEFVEDVRNLGLSNGQPSVLIILFRQPGANIIDTIDSVKAELPHLEAAMPADVNVTIAIDRSTTIRQSLTDTEFTLVLAIGLVTIVVYFFLRNMRATAIPSVAVPVSILGTFGAMYLLNYSLDILSLMALTIATGFVVDDAVVVLENISRHIEAGVPRLQAAFLGAREVGFTVLSISLSLIAVFLPVLLMGGILGRLFREFTMTLSLAIMISLVVSLTTTPMMCALLLRDAPPAGDVPRRRSLFDRALAGYERSLGWALQHRRFVLFIFFAAIVLNVVLFYFVPKGFFPEEDTGRLIGSLTADQSVSFQLMTQKLRQMMAIVQEDPAVEHVVGYTGVGSGGGFGQINTGSVFVSLKSIEQRPPIDEVIARLRPKLARVPGGRLFLFAVQDIRAGGRQSNAAYQYTLQSDDEAALTKWTPLLVSALEHSKVLADVNSDEQQRGLESDLIIDRPPRRASASRRRKSTIRSTTLSGSARCPSSTAPSISITSSWRSIRATRNIRRRWRRFMWRRRAAALRAPRNRTLRPAPWLRRARLPPAHPHRPLRPRRRTPTTIRRATPPSMRSPPAARAIPHLAPRFRPRWRRWCRSARSAITTAATRRCRSITRDCLSPPRFRSIFIRVRRSATLPTKSTTP